MSRESLDVFAEKVERKGKNALGLYVAINGFTKDALDEYSGLHAVHHDGRHGLDGGARRTRAAGRPAAAEEAAHERDRELLLPGEPDGLIRRAHGRRGPAAAQREAEMKALRLPRAATWRASVVRTVMERVPSVRTRNCWLTASAC